MKPKTDWRMKKISSSLHIHRDKDLHGEVLPKAEHGAMRELPALAEARQHEAATPVGVARPPT